MCMGGGGFKPPAVTPPYKPPTVSPPREAPKRLDPEVLRRRDKSQTERQRQTARAAGNERRRGPLTTTDEALS